MIIKKRVDHREANKQKSQSILISTEHLDCTRKDTLQKSL